MMYMKHSPRQLTLPYVIDILENKFGSDVIVLSCLRYSSNTVFWMQASWLMKIVKDDNDYEDLERSKTQLAKP